MKKPGTGPDDLRQPNRNQDRKTGVKIAYIKKEQKKPRKRSDKSPAAVPG